MDEGNGSQNHCGSLSHVLVQILGDTDGAFLAIAIAISQQVK